MTHMTYQPHTRKGLWEYFGTPDLQGIITLPTTPPPHSQPRPPTDTNGQPCRSRIPGPITHLISPPNPTYRKQAALAEAGHSTVVAMVCNVCVSRLLLSESKADRSRRSPEDCCQPTSNPMKTKVQHSMDHCVARTKVTRQALRWETAIQCSYWANQIGASGKTKRRSTGGVATGLGRPGWEVPPIAIVLGNFVQLGDLPE